MKTIIVDEPYQTGYRYTLTEAPGSKFRTDFIPDLTPSEMFRLCIYGRNHSPQVPWEFPAA